MIKEARQYIWLYVFYGATFTKKIITEPLKKVQNTILQQSNIFRSGYIDPHPTSTLPYFVHGTVLLLYSMHTYFIQVQNVGFTLRSFNLGRSSYILALVC